MKKTLFLFLWLMLYTAGLFAQITPCQKPNAFTELHGNQVKAGLLNGGDLFWDLAHARMETDTAAPGVSPVFAAALWLGGYDQGGNLHISAQTYRQSGSDFYAGPLDNAGTTNSNTCGDWDKIWHARGLEVRQFIYDWTNNLFNPCNYHDLLKWPGRNNPHSLQENGFALPPNQDFAPFFDKNNDGTYNPFDGDYPIVPNTNGSVIADDLAWTVFNDVGTGRTSSATGGTPLKAEVQMSFYAFNSSQATFLNNTIFGHYKIINKSGGRIDSLHIGMWEDPDLGCYNDDYIGSVPQYNTMYSYNADVTDEVICPNGGSLGYGNKIPAFSTTFLNKPMSKVNYYLNNTAPAPLPQMANPSNAQQYFNCLSGSWLDGTPFTTGGDGYNIGSTNTTNYVFPDNPNNSAGWSMQQLGMTPRDYRLLGASYFSNWQPMEVKELTMAFGTHIDRTASGNNLTSVNTMYAHLPLLQAFYDNGYQSSSMVLNNSTCTGNCVYPGDANIDGVVNAWDYLYPATSYNLTGTPRANPSNLFLPSQANNWTTSFTANLNAKYLDCDGNGVINEQDMSVISTNIDNQRSCVTAQPANAPNVQFYMTDFIGNRIDTADFSNFNALQRNFTLHCNIPNNDFYGIAFTLELDDNIFTGASLPSLQKPRLNYGDYKNVLKTYKNQSGADYKWDIVMTPTDGINTGTNDNLMKLYFNINTSVHPYGTYPGHIKFKNVRIIKNDGTILWQYGMQNQTIHLRQLSTATDQQSDKLKASSVYPNPVSDNLTIDLGEAAAATLHLYDIAGREITRKQLSENQTNLDVSFLSSGVYLVELSNEFGKITHRFVK